jgi:hypothetical protein
MDFVHLDDIFVMFHSAEIPEELSEPPGMFPTYWGSNHRASV